MILRPDTLAYLDAVERFAGKKFSYSREIALLMELAEKKKGRERFEELTFLAKFVTNASGLLKRTGPEVPDTAKLASEFRANVEKCHELLRSLLEEAPGEAQSLFTGRFLSLSRGSLDALLTLLAELSWVKNYSLEREAS